MQRRCGRPRLSIRRRRRSKDCSKMTKIPNIVRDRLKAAPAGDHPDANLLTAFAEQVLPDRERTHVLEHVSRCADCRDVLALAMPPMASTTIPGHKDTASVGKFPGLAGPCCAGARWRRAWLLSARRFLSATICGDPRLQRM